LNWEGLRFGAPNGQLDSRDINGDGVITPRQPGVFDASWDVCITFTDGPPMLFLNRLPGPAGTAFGFVDVTAANVPFIFNSVYGADIGDVDLDGDIDIALAIAAPFNQPHVILLLNDGTGRFTMASNEVPVNTSILPPPGVQDDFHVLCRDVKLFDVDMDGDLDMLLNYSGITFLPITGGALNALFVNRLVPENFNTLNRFRTYRSPFLIRLSPGAAYHGAWVTVNLMGQNLDAGVQSVYFGSGIAVYPVTRIAPNAYSVVIRIAQNATPGPRTVTATLTDGKTANLRNAFTVMQKKTAARSSWRQYP
jgi:hypothetical protein